MGHRSREKNETELGKLLVNALATSRIIEGFFVTTRVVEVIY